jgi:hypothetical protein
VVPNVPIVGLSNLLASCHKCSRIMVLQTGPTYVNFLELGDWTPEQTQSAYSAEDWERLVGLKSRYDPDNLFRFNRNIPASSASR